MRLGILLAFIVIIQLVHQTIIYPEIILNEGWLQTLVEQRTKKQADVLYFSASTNRAYASDDHHTFAISDLVQKEIKHLNVIDTGAIHGGIFLKILQKLPVNKLPKTIVMDLNIRSFGAKWIHSDLENALQRNFVYWNSKPSLINHLLAATKWYDYKSPGEHLRAIEYQQKFEELPFSKQHKTIKKWCDSLFKTTNFSDEGKTMIEHFGFSINKDNVRLASFDGIADFCKKNRIKLVFVILPENIEKMEDLVDATLPNLVHKNASFLHAHFTKRKIEVIDLHAEVEKYGFFESFPTEHYRDFGREIVAKSIVQVLQK